MTYKLDEVIFDNKIWILLKINYCGLYGWKIIFDRTLGDKWVIDDNLEIIFSTNNFYKYNMVFFFKYNYEILVILKE